MYKDAQWNTFILVIDYRQSKYMFWDNGLIKYWYFMYYTVYSVKGSRRYSRDTEDCSHYTKVKIRISKKFI